MMSTPVRLLLATTLVAGLVSCSFPTTLQDSGSSEDTPTAREPGLITPIATERIPTEIAFIPSVVPTKQTIQPAPPTVETITLAASQVLPCNRAAPGNPIDITIPDDSAFRPGEPFSKTWRLVNAGDCPWTADYTLVWFSGERLGANLTYPFTETIPPGDSIDLTVDMVAPQKPGSHQSTWKLKAKDGSLFGLGPNGDAPFWVRIVVLLPDTDTPEPTSIPPTENPPTVSPTEASTPLQTPTPVPPKSASLHPGEGLDLSNGQVAHGQSGDLLYSVDESGTYSLASINNSRLAVHGAAQPAAPDCQAAPLRVDSVILDEASVGVYLCIQAKGGAFGWLQIEAWDASSTLLALRYQLLTQ